ncbi:glycosyltransferase [Mycolicibacterium sp. S2-37]|uniref:glycosyltransferase n=1 Tax=Mycolicibacterium sp. S2-37 TaxID=2810297 RepID=UPI001A9403F0|nr:glycosyltransferase [Mycolicibacterium sp. S2-37]MBO0679003.1 glycosyltransferase [Mycolicibacterium sp. S2-37]
MSSRHEVSILGLNFPPEPTGIAPYTGALVAGLSQRGFSVTAHVAHPHYPEWRIREGYGQWTRNEHIDGVQVSRHLHYVPRSPRGVRRLLSEISFGVRLVFAKWNSPEIVIAVSPSLFSTAMAVVKARLKYRRPRLIVWIQDVYTLGLSETSEGSGFAAHVVRWVEAHTLRAADHVVVIHQRFAEYAVEQLGVSAVRLTVVRNWTHLPPSTEQMDRAAAKKALGWPAGVTVAVHAGNMGVKQGLDNLIEAAKIADETMAPVHFILVGDGGERQKLVELAKGTTRLTFVGTLDDEDYRRALSAADVLLVNEKPGVSAMAVPSKLTSYFDAGRPVVAATDPGGITASEVAESCAGVVVRAGEPRALLAAVIDVGSNLEVAAELGANGRRYRETVLDQSHAVEKFASLVRKLADG